MKRYIPFFIIAWKSFISLFALIAIPLLPLSTLSSPGVEIRKTMPYLLWIWGNFDGVHYVTVAQSGYLSTYQPFFPLYPLLIRLVSNHFHSIYILSGHMISLFALLLALLIIDALLEYDRYSHLKGIFLLVLFLFPTSFYYQAVYNDALFFLLASLCILLARRQQWFGATVVGAFATLTRLNGLVLVVPIAIEYLFRKSPHLSSNNQWRVAWQSFVQQWNHRKLLQWPILSIFLIPGSFLGYLWYIQMRFGDWHTLFTSMKTWGQDKVILPPHVVWRYINMLFFHPEWSLTHFIAFFEFSAVILYLALLVWSWRKIRLSYWCFFACSILVPWLTGTFQGMPRYGLHLYPFFLTLSLWLGHQSTPVRIGWFIASFSLLFISILLFTRGYFVS